MKKKLLVLAALTLALTMMAVSCKEDPVDPLDTTVDTSVTEEPTADVDDPTETPTTPVEDPTEDSDNTAEPDTTDEPDTTEDDDTTKAPVTTKADDTTKEPETTADPMDPVNVFDAADINNLTGANGIPAEGGIVATDNYITITPSTSDPYWYPFSGVNGARYISIKYRTSTATGADIQLYIGSSGNGPQDDSSMLKQPLTVDGEWHLAIIDTQSLIDAGIYNGSYVSYFRFDPLEAGYILNEEGEAYKDESGTWVRYPLPEGCSIDIEYIGFFHSEEAAQMYEIAPSYLITPEIMASASGNCVESAVITDNYVTLTAGNTDPFDPYLYIIPMGTTNATTGKLVALKYRTTTAGGGQFFIGNGAGPSANGDVTSFNYNADGEWHLMIIDLSDLTAYDVNAAYMRYDFFAGGTPGISIDVQYIGFFASEANAQLYDEIVNRLPEDTHNTTVSAGSNFTADDAADATTDIQNTDLGALLNNIKYGAGEAQYAYNSAEATPYYKVSSFTEMFTVADGTYAFKITPVSSAKKSMAAYFVRGVQSVHPTDTTGIANVLNNYYETDGQASGLAGAGIQVWPNKKIQIGIKYYDPNATTRIGTRIYLLDVNCIEKDVIITDDGSTVSIIVDDVLVATIQLSGVVSYEDMSVSNDATFAQKAVVTIYQGGEDVPAGTVETIENTLVASTHLSDLGLCTRTGTLTFTEMAILPLSAVEIPAGELPEIPEGPECYDNLVLDMTSFSAQSGYSAGWPEAGINVAHMKLGYGATIDLGSIDLSKYSSVKITYCCDGSEGTAGNFAAASSLAIGLKSENTSYGQATDDNFNGDIAHTDMVFLDQGWFAGARDAVVDLSAVDYNGNVWLAVHNPAGTEIVILGIEFVGAEIPVKEDLVIDVAGHADGFEFAAAGYTSKVLNMMNYGSAYNLGTVDLSKYSSVVITYGSDSSAKLGTVGSEIALTTNGAIEDASSNVIETADIIAKSVLTDATGGWASAERTVTLELNSDYNGEVYIAGDMKDSNGWVISSIVFIAKE